VLVVDDDDVDRESFRRVLARTGLSVQLAEASSSAEALEFMRGGTFDCAVLDQHLGDGLGTDLLQKLREQHGALPLLMTTASGDTRVAVRAVKNGAYDYLSKKDLDPERLLAAIEGSIRSAELEKEVRAANLRLTHLSLYDQLTDLPNRNLFLDRLEQALLSVGRGGQPFALLMMDLDRFKEINDSLGHVAGDQVLATVGRRFTALARKSDTYARLGGDEFAGLLLGTVTARGALTVAKKIAAAMADPVVVGQEAVPLGISIGVVVHRQGELDATTILAAADRAMYEAKRSGRGHVLVKVQDERNTRPLRISSRLPRALETPEVRLAYQPKVDLWTGALTGVEALLRWQSPELGTVAPAEFVPVAERSSLIHALSQRVLTDALDQHVAWKRDGHTIPIAVNLSARNFEEPTLTDRVCDELERRGLPGDILTLEITETALMSCPATARAAIRNLAKAGIRVSIDDFGTGFTSFRYLRDFDIAEIKIDRLFVEALEARSRDASIVKAIAFLGRSLGLDLVAEGIELAATWPLLRELGCTIGQGYGIARPMPPERVPLWIDHCAPEVLA